MSVHGDQQGEYASKLVFLQKTLFLLRSINASTMSNLSDGNEDEEVFFESDDKLICELSGDTVALIMGDTNGELSLLDRPTTRQPDEVDEVLGNIE